MKRAITMATSLRQRQSEVILVLAVIQWDIQALIAHLERYRWSKYWNHRTIRRLQTLWVRAWLAKIKNSQQNGCSSDELKEILKELYPFKNWPRRLGGRPLTTTHPHYFAKPKPESIQN